MVRVRVTIIIRSTVRVGVRDRVRDGVRYRVRWLGSRSGEGQCVGCKAVAVL